MNFGQAIEALKNGKTVSRAGWNGKGMFLWLSKGSFPFDRKESMPSDVWDEMKQIEGVNKNLFDIGDNGTLIRLPNINMKTATESTVTGWLASQTDLLAEDWGIVGEML